MYNKSLFYIVIIFVLLSVFHFQTYALTKRVYFEETNDTYIIEESGLFNNLDKPVIAVALGGGGARALVNVGVLKALEEENIPIDMVTGTSMGAIVAVMYGSGLSINDIEKLVTSDILQTLFDINLPFTDSILTGKKLNYLLEKVLPEKRLEDFPIPTALLSLDLTQEVKYVQTTGKISQVVQGSYAIPFIFPVSKHNNSYLIDPGVLELTPSLTAKLLGADIIISTTAYDKLPYTSYNIPFHAWMKMINFIKENNSERIVKRYSDIVIDHDVGKYSFMDFQLAEKFIRLGYERTKEKIPEIKKLLQDKEISLRTYDKLSNKAIDYMMEDFKYNREVLNYTSIKPFIKLGKDYSYFGYNFFEEVEMTPQYGLDIDINNVELVLNIKDNLNNYFEVMMRLKKLTPSLDLTGIYGNNNGNQLFDLVLFNHSKNNITGVGITGLEKKRFVHLINKYNVKYNKSLSVKGNINYYYSLCESKNEYILENEIEIPLSQEWKNKFKFVTGDTELYSLPVIYRGRNINEKPKLQGSVEIGYNHLFPYSIELIQILQLKDINFYQFFDYAKATKESYAFGSGLNIDINVLGVKPIALGGYLSYDINNDSYQTGLDIDITF